MNSVIVEGVKVSLAAYLHELGVAQSGAHKDHTVIQVGQTLSNGCLSLERDTNTSQSLRSYPHKGFK